MTATANGPVCGNCGVTVPPDALTCPACGVLLAAYQSTGGSETLSIPTSDYPGSSPAAPVATDIPLSPPVVPPGVSPASPSTVPSPPPTPRSTSPIGDALRRSHQEAQSSLHHDTPPEPTAPSSARAPYVAPTPPPARPVSSSPIGDALRRSHEQSTSSLYPQAPAPATGPDDLAAMADGDDELANMADGNDALSEMAAGNDELADMASGGSPGTFEQKVNAELAGAKVVFAGDKPVIEAEAVEVVAPGEGEPEVVAHREPAPAVEGASTPASAPAPATSQRPAAAKPQRPTPAERGQVRAERTAAPARASTQPSTPPTPAGQTVWPQDTTRPQPWPQLQNMVGSLMAIPFLLIVCVILGAGRGVGGFMLISFITMAIIVYLLVRAAGLTRRKTTTMPRNDRRNRR